MPRPRSPKVNGRAIEALRSAKGLRQTDLARSALISPQYLADIERGSRNASTSVAARLAIELGVELGVIVPDAA